MAVAIIRLIRYLAKYPERLEKRRNKPETREQFYQAVDTQFEHFLIHQDQGDLKLTLHEEWKKTWWDRNPGWSDIVMYGIPIAVLIGLGMYASSNTPPPNHAAANFPGVGYNLAPPPVAPPAYEQVAYHLDR